MTQRSYGPVADRIPRDRFFEISRYLHFVDNSEILPHSHPNFDRLWKVRPIINMVSETFLNSYNPHMQNAVDEAMIPFKGRSSLKQYMPKKPVKRGFKVWVRADSLNGYICQFAVYVGKEGERVEVGLGQKVVEKLTRKLVGGQYHIYYDNFFTGAELAQNLPADGIYSCGTILSKRKHIPEDLKPHIKKGLKERGDYTHTETKFKEVLQSITTAPWYTTNTKLQEYIQSEWISCKQVSAFSLYKYNLCHTGLCPFLYACSYGHMPIDKFSTQISTPTTSLSPSIMP